MKKFPFLKIKWQIGYHSKALDELNKIYSELETFGSTQKKVLSHRTPKTRFGYGNLPITFFFNYKKMICSPESDSPSFFTLRGGNIVNREGGYGTFKNRWKSWISIFKNTKIGVLTYIHHILFWNDKTALENNYARRFRSKYPNSDFLWIFYGKIP